MLDVLKEELNVAIYCRLSREDGDSGESNSIKTQREILVDYVEKNNWNIYNIYADDGYSGGNFNRPGWKRLINDVDSGEIFYNDRNIKDISIKDLYDNVNLFSQTTYLFTGTILENLLIANPNASEEEVIEACKNASIYKYIKSLSDGFETKITDLKDNLSSGEKQRLGLARVFLRKPKLLLLDEATSNIDAINEGIVLNALKKYKKDMTIIMISHRKSTLSICDKIFELKNGGIKNES